jgi:hypothetical protein
MATRRAPATRPTGASVEEFLARVPDERRREDARRLCAMMAEITSEPPVLWGASIIGFGTYHYRYVSGHEGDSALAGFSPQRQHLAIYLVAEFEHRHRSALARLGPHRTGKGCLYLKRLDDVDAGALRELIDRSVRIRRGIGRQSGAMLQGQVRPPWCRGVVWSRSHRAAGCPQPGAVHRGSGRGSGAAACGRAGSGARPGRGRKGRG